MCSQTSHIKTNAIVFYDGACALCHATVRFSLARDKNDLLYFAPLGGETMQRHQIDTKGMKSVILFIESTGETFYKSDAVIALLERLGGIWFILAKIMKIIPGIIRDSIYDYIAKIRYKLFGKIDDKICPLLPKNYQSKILL